MPTGTRAVRREHVESYFAQRRDEVAPATLSIEFRALQQFFRWAVEEDEIDRSPMEKMAAPRAGPARAHRGRRRLPKLLEDGHRA